MSKHLLITALTAVLLLPLAADTSPYSPPPNAPFQPLIEDIEKM